MNLLLIEAHEIGAGNLVRLADRRARHLREVLKVEAGRELRAGVVGGGVGTARVREASPKGVVVELEVGEAPPELSAVELVLALPRPAVLHRVLQHATAFGVRRIDLINAWRVEKSFFGSPALDPAAIRRHLLLGAEQGMTTRLPEVTVHRRLVPFLERLEPDVRGVARLLAHPEAGRPMEAVRGLRERGSCVVLALGPEGGWIDREVTSFEERGFEAVRLGPWILRVEAALAAALAQLAMVRRAPPAAAC